MNKNKQAAFMELYNPVHLQLSNYCRSMARNRMDAEDLLNDTVLAAFEQFEELNDNEKFAAYVFTIASNLYKKHLRRRKFKGDYIEKEALMLSDLDASPEIKAELSLIIHKMELLPRLQREALILFHISDLPMVEIQKIQGGSLSAIKQRIKRGRERLLQLLTDKQRKVVTLIF